MKGYCVKCRQKREMERTHNVKIKGRDAVKGNCSKCSTKMCVFI